MELAEIVLPMTEPETEWIDGEAVQKVSPSRGHGRLAFRLAAALEAWGHDRGQAAVEWRFRLKPPGTPRQPLVPDVAWVSNERLRALSFDDAESPAFAPDVAIEVLSKDDRAPHVDWKIRCYLSCETRLVIVVDPAMRTVRLIDRNTDRTLSGEASIEHPVLPGFSLELPALFTALDLPK